MLSSVPEISSGIHYLPCFGKLACHPTPALSLCVFSDLCWILAALLGGWLVTLLLFSPLCLTWLLLGAGCSSGRLACHPAPTLSLCCFTCALVHWEFDPESLAPWPSPVLWGRFSVPAPPPLSVLDYSSLFIFFNFAGEGGSVCPGAALDYFSRG
jgi:hypothetical protein